MKDLNPQKLHHAYILEGEKDPIYEQLRAFCEEELLFKIKANPDFWYSEHDRFLVDDARLLREMQLKKTKEGGRKIFILSFNFITREAQNSLLKVLEEPTSGTHIFLITPSAHVFLDTVRSRTITLSISSDKKDIQAEDFIKASYKDRILIISKLVENIKKEKASKADALNMVRSIRGIIHKEFLKNPNKKTSTLLQEIGKIEDYLHDSGASTKILLEHLAIYM